MTTFIDLTNRLLRRLNEVEIPSDQFLSVRNMQATAKDTILDTIREINNRKNNWVFNAVEHTQVLTKGQQEYPWPVNFNNVDWTSFQIQRDDNLGILNTKLYPITREEWYRRYRDYDYDTKTDGRSIPNNVFGTHGQGWGVTPSPDEAYTIKYRYFKNPEDLVNPDDICTIPSKFDYVIIYGALLHMNIFKDNAENVMIAERRYMQGLNDMVKQQVYWPNQAIDTRFKDNWSYDG